MNGSIEFLEFSLCIKLEYLELNIKYIAGKNIIFNNSNLQIIPNKKQSRFDQESLTLLSINT